jgi:hypothetical protein
MSNIILLNIFKTEIYKKNNNLKRKKKYFFNIQLIIKQKN